MKTLINQIIKESYLLQKKRYKKEIEIPEELQNAWEFIDQLFILESKHQQNYYDILTFIIPLLKPTNKKEEKDTFITYLNLIGITNHHPSYLEIIDYYENDDSLKTPIHVI